jgi:hypothetical protein
MKIKVSEATPTQLNWLVESIEIARMRAAGEHVKAWWVEEKQANPSPYCSDWLLTGPILDENNISTIRCDDEYGVDKNGFTTSERIPVWAATTGQHGWSESYNSYGEPCGTSYELNESEMMYGPTKLIAGLRCYVASELGSEAEVPDDLK